MENKTLTKELETHLGANGKSFRLKQRYRKYQNHLLIHRANLCLESFGVIWSGDLDFTMEESFLKKLCKKHNLSIYILKELDGRFNPQNPPLEKSLIKINNKKTILNVDLHGICKRDVKGKWKLNMDLSFLYPQEDL